MAFWSPPCHRSSRSRVSDTGELDGGRAVVASEWPAAAELARERPGVRGGRDPWIMATPLHGRLACARLGTGGCRA